jgi:signal transduction histidine kinase
MRIASRTKAIAFFITLGSCLVGLAIALNISWIILNWRETVALVLGIIFFGFIVAGLVLNTIFLVREIKRNEQQESFLNAVTHELKTPIASIRLYLETLQQRQLAEAQRQDFYRVMLDDTDRLLGTVEQVLKAGEIRNGGGKKSWEQVDFSRIVQDSVDLARIRHKLSDGQLRFNANLTLATTVLGNAEELRIAVANLLDNAVKYSGVKKDIVVNVTTSDIDNIMLTIHDEGIGIPRSELKRVFKRFYRVHAATGQAKGTGLGLFIVRSVARRHGGDAFAESEGEGLGSTFSIRLPRVYKI